MITGELFGGTVHWTQLPVYLVAEVVGAVAAGIVHAAFKTRPATVANQVATPAVCEGVPS
ncbi:hypothetical protein [Streptomyces sp. 3N207]|uniref:hypothetical protein n=1 Tax=Streptomyces sp. 3N207 TaxID=3457417 RepID=UPI003FD0AD10